LEGRDIIPEVTVVREWGEKRRVASTRRGRDLLLAIEQLERLIAAYRRNAILPRQ
jgi:fructose-1,6-bisphosphatase